jgi:hypothetical protein
MIIENHNSTFVSGLPHLCLCIFAKETRLPWRPILIRNPRKYIDLPAVPIDAVELLVVDIAYSFKDRSSWAGIVGIADKDQTWPCG